MRTPTPRGALSARVIDGLTSDPDTLGPEGGDDGWEDRALALWVLHELHYGGFEDVDDDAEWSPGALAVRRELERGLEASLRERWEAVREDVAPSAALPVAEALFTLVDEHDGASVARYVQTDAMADQALDLLRMRSIYHLKESDPTAWLVPRLPVAAKAALMELQFDEYGAGDPRRLHHHLFALGMSGAGLSDDYGAYVDAAPAEVLEQNNTVTMVGLHRRLRAAAAGHLAAFEATSSVPSRRMAQGLERLGLGDAVVAYYAEHITADAVHDQLAARAICGALVEHDPGLRDDVLFGAWTCLDLEDRFARMALARWAA